MPRVSLPQRQRGSRLGLAVLWEQGDAQPESLIARILQVVALVVRRFRAAPLGALAAIVSLTAVTSVALILFVVGVNARNALSTGTEQILVRVVPLQEADAPALAGRLAKLPSVAKVRVVTKEQALEEFAAALGSSRGLLEGLEGENPLPATVELGLGNLGAAPDEAIAGIVESLHRQEGVADVIYNRSLADSLGSLIRGVRVLGLVSIVAVLMIGSLLVGLTIRLAVYAHRHEIEVMQLVGADRRQIQLPFLMEGVVVGIVAAAMSGVVLLGTLRWLGDALTGSRLSWVVSDGALIVPPFGWVVVALLAPLLAMVGAIVALRIQGER